MPDAHRRWLVGSGGFLRRPDDLRRRWSSWTPPDQLPGDGPLEPRRLGPRATGDSLGRISFGERHGAVLPTRRSRRRGSPSGSRTRGSSPCAEATAVRGRAATAGGRFDRWPPRTGVTPGELYFRARREASSLGRLREGAASGVRQLRLRPGPPGPLPQPADPAHLRLAGLGLVHLAGRGPAVRSQPARRPRLADRAAHRGPHDRRRRSAAQLFASTTGRTPTGW